MTPALRAGAVVVLLGLMLSLVPARAQTPRFRAGVAAVRVDALVTDGGRPVQGLTASNFELRDNGVLQQVTDVHHETLPLNIICALDVSASVKGEPLTQLKRALVALIDALGDRDRAALLTFSNVIQLHSPLTGDRARLRDLAQDVTSGGTTSFHDATFAALALREADGGRTMLLLFSDGNDTSSWLSARQLLDAAQHADVVIYPVTVRATQMMGFEGSSMRSRVRQVTAAERMLDALADETGGRVVYAAANRSLATTFLDVLAEFRQRYVLTYQPSGVAAGGWHEIAVRLRGKRGDVKARRGYFAAATPGEASRTPR